MWALCVRSNIPCGGFRVCVDNIKDKIDKRRSNLIFGVFLFFRSPTRHSARTRTFSHNNAFCDFGSVADDGTKLKHKCAIIIIVSHLFLAFRSAFSFLLSLFSVTIVTTTNSTRRLSPSCRLPIIIMYFCSLGSPKPLRETRID